MFKKKVASAILKTAVSTIEFEDLSRYLPFQTRVVSGSTYNHIQSQTAYDITTYGRPWARNGLTPYPLFREYTISEGDTLCRRNGRLLFVRAGVMDQNCPGCEAIAQGLIKRDIENA
jgi:hypothetical protein